MKKLLSMFLTLCMTLSLCIPATAANVVLSPQNLTVDGKAVTCEKYNIGGANYFKLRDLAQALSGTSSQFEVGWDGATGTVSITTGKAYTSVGGELSAGADKSSTAQVSKQTIQINGVTRSDLSAYNIGGANFFKLRDLGTALGFGVDFDSATNTATVKSGVVDTSELGLAFRMGFVPTSLQSDYSKAITASEFCTMLTQVVKSYAPDKARAWEDAAATAMKSNRNLTRDAAILSVYEAACAMGLGERARGDWLAANDQMDATGWNWQLTWDYPDWPNWKSDSPFVGTHNTVNYMTAAIHFSQGLYSQESGKSAFDIDLKDVSAYMRGAFSREEAVLAVLRFYESLDKTADSTTAAKIVADANALRDAIRNSKTEVSYTGKAFYVSNSAGNDANDGTSPAKAVRTIARLETLPIRSGDAVFFKRGDIWRGEELRCRAGVTYSAYGEGEKPRFYGAKEDGVGAEKWTLYYEGANGEKIWKFYRDMRETGGVIFNGGASWAERVYGWWVEGSGYMQYDDTTKSFTPEACLTSDMTMCSMIDYSGCSYPILAHSLTREGGLYVRCDKGNPGALFSEVEFESTETSTNGWVGIVNCADNCVIDNLCVMYFAKCGIQSHVLEVKGVTVQNCEVGWGGNAIHEYHQASPGRDYMLSGDGIYGIFNGGTVRGNYCHDLDANGITFESARGQHATTVNGGLTVSGNLTEHCGEGIWLHDPMHFFTIKEKLIIRDNMCLGTGEGYTHGSWCPFYGIAVDDGVTIHSVGVEITGNTVYRAKDALLYIGPNVTLANNRFYQ